MLVDVVLLWLLLKLNDKGCKQREWNKIAVKQYFKQIFNKLHRKHTQQNYVYYAHHKVYAKFESYAQFMILSIEYIFDCLIFVFCLLSFVIYSFWITFGRFFFPIEIFVWFFRHCRTICLSCFSRQFNWSSILIIEFSTYLFRACVWQFPFCFNLI